MTSPLPRAVVHLDCDGIEDIFSVHGWAHRGEGDELFDRGLPRMLDFLDAQRVRATLFVVARSLEVPARRARLREAVARGHEIASHSLTHRPLPALGGAEKRREIYESAQRISEALGRRPIGFRAPNFEIDRECLEAVSGAGYCFDSSLHPGRHPVLGRVEAGPHWLLGGSLLELPMPSRAALPLPFHPSYSLVLGSSYFRAGVAVAARAHAPLILLFHLTDLADPLPAAALPTWRAKFFTLSWLSAGEKARRCGRMLDHLRARFELTDTTTLLAGLGVAA